MGTYSRDQWPFGADEGTKVAAADDAFNRDSDGQPAMPTAMFA